MRKCTKSWESAPKPEKVWKSAPKPEKVWESAPKLEKVRQNLRKCAKTWESLLNANANCYLFAVQMLFFDAQYKSLLKFLGGLISEVKNGR